MKVLLWIILLSSLAASCVTQRKCLQRFPPSIDTIKTIEYRDTIIFRDTTVFIKIKGDTIRDSIFIETPVPLNTEKLRSETPLAWAEAWIENSFLMLNLTQRDTTILTRLEGAIKEARHWQIEYEKIKEVTQPLTPEKYIPQIYKIALWILIGICSAGLIYLGIKIAK